MFQSLQPYFNELASALIGMFVIWWPNRKKQKIDNHQAIVDLYQDTLTDLKTRYEEKYQDLKSTFDLKLNAFSNKIDGLQQSLDEWKKKYFNLKKDFDNYKKEHP
ncbi:MAG: hypothetical protein ABIP27_17415 [Flavobacterium circumlabens]|uniref:hypothetical protein n=1 Tax=Flavobacterium circumlabens TaxID=2133765 RepID=UPI003266994C